MHKLLILDKGKVIDYGNKEELFRKYCGRAVMVIDYSKDNERLTKNYKKLASPAHLLALSCESEEQEKEIAELFLKNNINYKRSNNDIEIMYINAKENYEKAEGKSYAE